MTNTSSYLQAQVAGMLADQTGTPPSTGTARHYGDDNLGSARGIYGDDTFTLGCQRSWPDPRIV